MSSLLLGECLAESKADPGGSRRPFASLRILPAACWLVSWGLVALGAREARSQGSKARPAIITSLHATPPAARSAIA